MKENIILLTDSYKVTHWKQYPPDTETVFSYFESRGGRFPDTVFFGLQYFLKEYLAGEVVTEEKIEEAKRITKNHLGDETLFNEEGWRYILNEHGGKLPVRIRAVPEGTVVPVSNVLITIENTDPKCYWLTNYLETLLVQTWYPTTVATLSHHIKAMIYHYMMATGGNLSLLDFKLHDFGFRGVSSVESAGIGGLAHLLNFKGTDTLEALLFAERYYNQPKDDPAGFSIPASEHSTMTAWGKEHEAEAMANMLKQYPKGLVACVSDSYDIYNACENIWGKQLKEQVLNREGTLVVRPDSGEPKEVVLNVLVKLGDKLGKERNQQGYYMLVPQVRVIQGDGVNFEAIRDILSVIQNNKWSADNIAFGMGGALLQKLNRDTQKFAFKCSAVKRSGRWQDVWKDPVTDKGKISKAGRLTLIQNEDKLETKAYQVVYNPDGFGEGKDIMRTVFENGELLVDDSLKYIRARLNTYNAINFY